MMTTSDAEFQCTNCDGSGYFDTPNGGEVACSVCHGKAAYSPQEIARMEAAEDEVERLQAQVEAQQWDQLLTPRLAVHVGDNRWATVVGEGAQRVVDMLTERDKALAEVERLQAELADCQQARTRNADAAARAIDELAQ